MKPRSNSIIFFLLICFTGCSDKREVIVETPIPFSSQSIVAEKIAVVFREAVTESEAVKMIEDFKLTISSIYGFGTMDTHAMIIIVKDGEEQKWIDILKEYPQVESSSRLLVAFIE